MFGVTNLILVNSSFLFLIFLGGEGIGIKISMALLRSENISQMLVDASGS